LADLASNHLLSSSSHLKPTQSANKESHNEIPVDATESDLIVLLNLIHKRDVPLSEDWAQCDFVLKLCDLYACDLVVERSSAALTEPSSKLHGASSASRHSSMTSISRARLSK